MAHMYNYDHFILSQVKTEFFKNTHRKIQIKLVRYKNKYNP